MRQQHERTETSIGNWLKQQLGRKVDRASIPGVLAEASDADVQQFLKSQWRNKYGFWAEQYPMPAYTTDEARALARKELYAKWRRVREAEQKLGRVFD